MKIAVWDTYVSGKNGKRMHFDILVPADQKDEQVIHNFGKDYLQSKQVGEYTLSSEECRFCHIEEASPEMLAAISAKGYFIIELDGCN